ncbi:MULTISPECIES: hypothetical protein [unclassified Frigoribacterium]|uniref:hypothetical protein n=1 Tax=unclassified Frigoribacterium TaxID=2627005 RepID=UPI001566691A|nr:MULTISPECIES: hypothetical protein [unclassified Frigoribacterium]NQW88594.1 hypothetical protein [Frigoribacterium sp. VKM Ac-2860]NQX08597.1 hypothetical protein [Frigoribacterium sp. VKM Ac-2859]
MSDRDQTPAPDTTPRDDASGASETVDPAGHDVDATYTVPGSHSESAAEKAGTPEQAIDEAREGEAPDPADVHVASDEYPEVPAFNGITASDRSV